MFRVDIFGRGNILFEILFVFEGICGKRKIEILQKAQFTDDSPSPLPHHTERKYPMGKNFFSMDPGMDYVRIEVQILIQIICFVWGALIRIYCLDADAFQVSRVAGFDFPKYFMVQNEFSCIFFFLRT